MQEIKRKKTGMFSVEADNEGSWTLGFTGFIMQYVDTANRQSPTRHYYNVAKKINALQKWNDI